MTTTTTEKTVTDTFDAAQQSAEQIRQFGERATDAGRALGRLTLDTYEQAVATLIDFEKQAADAAPADWMKAAISAHASFVQEMNAAYVRTLHSVLD
jgi:hypothetical protein